MSFFNKPKSAQDMSTLEVATELALKNLMATGPETREYTRLLSAIERLTELQKATSRRVSPDTIAVVAANIVGILLIINHERASVVASKALGFVQRLGR
jgi:plasmid replication initiation protein